MMSVGERERVVRYLEETRAGVISLVESFSEDAFRRAPAPGCWSAAETLEHIAFVEGRAMLRITGALKEPGDGARKSAMDGRDEELFAGVRGRFNKIESPAMAQPVGGKSREDLLAQFEGARQASLQFARETEADLRSHFGPHPLLGDLDCYQWLMLIPSHCERHMQQIAECREPAVLLD